MTELMELTKSDIIAMIDDADVSIDEIKNAGPMEIVPEHDFYRAVMFAECIPCGNRYVDVGECAVCKPGKEFLQKYKENYPWKSGQKRG